MSPEAAAALISGTFLLLVALIERTRRENNRDHGRNADKLDRVLEATKDLKKGHERIERKVDTHINDHARGDV